MMTKHRRQTAHHDSKDPDLFFIGFDPARLRRQACGADAPAHGHPSAGGLRPLSRQLAVGRGDARISSSSISSGILSPEPKSRALRSSKLCCPHGARGSAYPGRIRVMDDDIAAVRRLLQIAFNTVSARFQRASECKEGILRVARPVAPVPEHQRRPAIPSHALLYGREQQMSTPPEKRAPSAVRGRPRQGKKCLERKSACNFRRKIKWLPAKRERPRPSRAPLEKRGL